MNNSKNRIKIIVLIIVGTLFSSCNVDQDVTTSFHEQIIGNIEGIKTIDGKYFISGWACQNSVEESIIIRVRLDSPWNENVEQRGYLFKQGIANLESEESVVKICNTEISKHNFLIPITTEEIADFKGKKIFIHGIADTGNTSNSLLDQSGEHIIPDQKVIGNIDGIEKVADKFYIKGWACDRTVSTPISISLWVGGSYHDNGIRLLKAVANREGSEEISLLCANNSPNRRFRILLSREQVQNFENMKIYIHGISTKINGINFLLSNSGNIPIPKHRPLFGIIRWDMLTGNKVIEAREANFFSSNDRVTANHSSGTYLWRAPFYSRPVQSPEITVPVENEQAPDYTKSYPIAFHQEDVDLLHDIQERVDKEIDYADQAGIDYYIFGFDGFNTHTAKDSDIHPPNEQHEKYVEYRNANAISYGLRAYLNSVNKRKINFSLYVTGAKLGWDNPFNKPVANDGDQYYKDSWTKWVQEIVVLMSDSSYQKVKNKRPIVFFFRLDEIAHKLGDPRGQIYGWNNLKNAIEELNVACTEANLELPYIVSDLPNPDLARYDSTETISSVRNKVVTAWLASKTIHSVNPYHFRNGATPEGTKFSLWWDHLKVWMDGNKSRGFSQIPMLMSGADWSPRYNILPHVFSRSYYNEPVGDDLSTSITNTINYCKNSTNLCDADTMIMYAWNEFTEGGFVAPLRKENGVIDRTRLDQLEKGLKQ